jgi:rRNA small subunit pseudouridine methyltransferase Nep1
LKLNVIIAESALELVPDEIQKHHAVSGDGKRRGIHTSRILLDRSIHHAAMRRLENEFKRGRPDLLYLTLLSITSAPMYQDGSAKIFVHTLNHTVLEIEEKTRPPRSYSRFRNLFESVLYEKPKVGLIKVYGSTVRSLVRETIHADDVVGLSVLGKLRTLEDLATEVVGKKNPAVVIGGFPKGHFSPETLKAFDEFVRIDERPLDAHVVASRLVYEIEKLYKDK